MLSNSELYDKLEKQFGVETMIDACFVISTMFNHIYKSSPEGEVINEASYERDWWMTKHNELTKV